MSEVKGLLDAIEILQDCTVAIFHQVHYPGCPCMKACTKLHHAIKYLQNQVDDEGEKYGRIIRASRRTIRGYKSRKVSVSH